MRFQNFFPDLIIKIKFTSNKSNTNFMFVKSESSNPEMKSLSKSKNRRLPSRLGL